MAKGVPKPNKYADGLLMTLLTVEVGVIIHTLRNDLQLLGLLAALIVVVAVAVNVTKLCFRVGGGWFSRTYLKHLGNPLKKRTTMKKWCDQSWQLVIHTSMAVFEFMVMKDETWWQDTRTLWNQGSSTGVFPEQKFSTKLLYLTQLAIWIYTAFSCKFLEEIRKDYLVMMSHHVVTIALVTWSYAVGFLPIGVLVLFLHDLSDIPLDMLKMANYMKLEGLRGFLVCEILYVILLVDWSYFRIYLYPAKLIRTAFIENRLASMTVEDAYDFTNLFPNPGPPSWFLFNVLLITLYFLHVWWGFLIFRLLFGIMNKGAHEAGKDEYEGNSLARKASEELVGREQRSASSPHPLLSLVVIKHNRTVCNGVGGAMSISEVNIVKALEKILPPLDADLVTIKIVLSNLAKVLEVDVEDLKPHKNEIKGLITERIHLCKGGSADNADDDGDKENIEEEDEDEEVVQRGVKRSRSTKVNARKSNNIIVSDEEDDDAESEEQYEEVDSEDEKPKKKTRSKQSKKNKPTKRSQKSSPPAKKPKAEKAVDPPGLTALKEYARLAGVMGPAMYRKLREASSTSEAEEIIRDKLDAAGYSIAGPHPKKQELDALKQRKARERELDGIDTSLIIESGRRRRGAAPTSFVTHNAVEDDDDEDNNSTNGDAADDAGNGAASESEDAESDAASEASFQFDEESD
ncbi:TPA: hypothetical protein N0F65_011677 [Lagenidium giganteum]|uniref:TLC domain-containing protein n=1 Tax=Lagenidium giganteum TaxID=4803 RepID=A0AAV2ZDS9_9STRA|nr:TPA: hypothetical protein N0F65_011677 [Lagenidium giganteum]